MAASRRTRLLIEAHSLFHLLFLAAVFVVCIERKISSLHKKLLVHLDSGSDEREESAH